LNYKGMTEQDFARKAVLNHIRANEDDDVIFSGLFLNFQGAMRNYPIVRHGKIAMLPDEKVFFDETDPPQDLILAEVTSFGGNSGSPVFLELPLLRIPQIADAKRYYLLGVMKGFFGAPNVPQNSGIAAIVPSEEIFQLLQTPELGSYRWTAIAGAYLQQPGDILQVIPFYPR